MGSSVSMMMIWREYWKSELNQWDFSEEIKKKLLVDLLDRWGGIGGSVWWLSSFVDKWTNSSMRFFMARFDLSESIDMSSNVIGLMGFLLSQSIIAVRSYVWQSEPITGSRNIWCVMGQWSEWRFGIVNVIRESMISLFNFSIKTSDEKRRFSFVLTSSSNDLRSCASKKKSLSFCFCVKSRQVVYRFDLWLPYW